MRSLHRWIAPCAVLFLTVIAATGAYMQGDTLWRRYHPVPRVEVETHPLPVHDIPRWLAAALTAAERAHPEGAIARVSIGMDGTNPRADIIWTRPDIHPLSINPQTGDLIHLSTAAAPQPLSLLLGQWMLRLHRGDLLGLPGYWLGFVCGLALFTLGLTGLLEYLRIYLKRIKLRRWSPFW